MADVDEGLSVIESGVPDQDLAQEDGDGSAERDPAEGRAGDGPARADGPVR